MSQKNANNQHNYSLDLLRVLATFAVIWLHITAGVKLKQPDLQNLDWFILNFSVTMSIWCAPMFVMISGVLLLNQNSHENPYEFYRRRLSRILIPTLFWTLVYLAVNSFETGDFHLRSALKMVIFGRPYYHMWFVYMIIGLYAAAPFLSKFTKGASTQLYFLAIVLSFSTAAFYDFIAKYQQIVEKNPGVTTSSIVWWPLYIGYFLAGSFMVYASPKQISKKLLWCSVFICLLAMVSLTAIFYPYVNEYAGKIIYSYVSPFVIIMSLSLFLAVYTNDSPKTPAVASIIKRIAPMTFGIYLVHPLWQNMLVSFGINGSLWNSVVGIPIVTFIVFALSLATVFLISRIPWIRYIT